MREYHMTMGQIAELTDYQIVELCRNEDKD